MRGALSVHEEEALVLLEAMQTAYNMNMHNIIFETDAQVVAGAVHAKHGG
ncbi:hypothetical protein A2U01_0070059, partial [Trifolium medium]|nr:hypothetical protein [Trifolium medium]